MVSSNFFLDVYDYDKSIVEIKSYQAICAECGCESPIVQAKNTIEAQEKLKQFGWFRSKAHGWKFICATDNNRLQLEETKKKKRNPNCGK